MEIMETEQYGTPVKQSFFFGKETCAYCLDIQPMKHWHRKTYFVWPERRGFDEEILIPGGRQAFHKECLKQLKADERGEVA